MIPLSCLQHYRKMFVPAHEPFARDEALARHLAPETAFSLLNSYDFPGLWLEENSNQIIRQTLRVVDKSGEMPSVRLLFAASYEIPRRFGMISPKSFETSIIVRKIEWQSRSQGWSDCSQNFKWDATKGRSATLLFAFHLYSNESSHDWMERALTARPLFDDLSASGLDVRPDLEKFLANAAR